jgi:hypothetical protein
LLLLAVLLYLSNFLGIVLGSWPVPVAFIAAFTGVVALAKELPIEDRRRVTRSMLGGVLGVSLVVSLLGVPASVAYMVLGLDFAAIIAYYHGRLRTATRRGLYGLVDLYFAIPPIVGLQDENSFERLFGAQALRPMGFAALVAAAFYFAAMTFWIAGSVRSRNLDARGESVQPGP